jgi:hypothetical protein
MVHPLPVGNAMQLVVAAPRGAAVLRVLRRAGGDGFTGPDDASPGVVRVADAPVGASLVDISGLENGTTYTWRVWYKDAAGSWLPASTSGARSGTPQATYRGDDPDPQTLLALRLELGLRVEVQRGRLRPSARTGRVGVVLAPFALADAPESEFPVVSVHVEHDTPEARAIGEVLLPDLHADGAWTETTGWLSRVVVNVVGATRNPDGRAALRRAIKRIVLANLPVFDAMGLSLVEFAQQDAEDLSSLGAPVYFTRGTFSCMVGATVESDVGEIEDVVVTAVQDVAAEMDEEQ